MRVYAMYGRSRWIAVMFVVVAAVDVAVGCVSLQSRSGTILNEHISGLSCQCVPHPHRATRFLLVGATARWDRSSGKLTYFNGTTLTDVGLQRKS